MPWNSSAGDLVRSSYVRRNLSRNGRGAVGLPRLGVRARSSGSLGAMSTMGMGSRATRTGALPRLGHTGESITNIANSLIRTPPPPVRGNGRILRALGDHKGKIAAAAVVAYGIGGLSRRTGRATDRSVGRQTGMYQY